MSEAREAYLEAAGGAAPHVGWEDKRLVDACLGGDDGAWNALVDKYKNLVYGIAVRYGAQPDDAADLFQAVWIDVYEELGRLRKRGSVRSWLISVTRHKCYHWKRKYRREALKVANDVHEPAVEAQTAVDPIAIEDLERDQLVGESIATLPPRCQELICLLFFVDPPRPYKEVARTLGLAIGSIGFIRGRCLKRLQKNLERRNVR